MILSAEVTPAWAVGRYRRWDASIEGKASRLCLVIDEDGSATVEVDDAEHLRRDDVRQWIADCLVSPAESPTAASTPRPRGGTP